VRVEKIFPAGGKRILVLFGQSLVEPVFSSESDTFATLLYNELESETKAFFMKAK